MAAATRQRLIRFGHETGHDAKLRADFFGTGLEEDGAIGLFHGLAKANRCLIDTGPGFGVQAFHRHTKSAHVVHDGVQKIPVLVHAQERVAEHSRGDGFRVHALFGGPALGRFEKVEPLELHPRHDLETELLGALQNALQNLARALRVGRAIGIDKLAQYKGHIVVPGHAPCGIHVQPR